MSYSVSVEIPFDAAHRLYNFEGKCYNLHGHTYCATIDVTCVDLTPPGFVVDFGKLKSAVKRWINDHWDHATILWTGDPLAKVLKDQGVRTFLMNHEPTAEYMAECLFMNVDQLLPDTVTVTSVSIMETPTSTATYSLSQHTKFFQGH